MARSSLWQPRMAACVALALLACAPPAARAAQGDLTVAGCFGAPALWSCQTTAPAPASNFGYGKVVVAPDRSDAYAIAGGAVVRLHRASDGALSFVSCIADVGVDGCARQMPERSYAIVGLSDIVVSPDGRDVYTTAYWSDAVAHFRIDAHGDLAYVGCFGPVGDGCTPAPGTDD